VLFLSHFRPHRLHFWRPNSLQLILLGPTFRLEEAQLPPIREEALLPPLYPGVHSRGCMPRPNSLVHPPSVSSWAVGFISHINDPAVLGHKKIVSLSISLLTSPLKATNKLLLLSLLFNDYIRI